ncbi:MULTISPECIES: type II toxin-antitoxin system VapC family toxin [Nostoc]|uniref:Type II toxin-antitoxin system VapC family toxin n=2 Tax=Nostoc TaxID=1177 RepID=A0ABR8IH95_9NOSO|nr:MULTISPECIES: type II toxin-antitoxin system VapC family toxin [Nostoc]MBD2559356.1 type II toxin-antitoxin system VapC family toxin [Nostoc linckia FACHB-391]MBD2650207.1 type II toxin-antitoxin system VapC family toxin [Nostoc foliaceum FACHB-393]
MCLDTSVWIPYLVPEVYQPQFRKLVAEALSLSIRLVTPAFVWTEVGSVLRKKNRMGVITTEEALDFFEDFCELPIDYIEEEAIRAITWKIADKYGLSTLYDAAFLACAESASAEFWTADAALVRQLTTRPAYLREIGEL